MKILLRASRLFAQRMTVALALFLCFSKPVLGQDGSRPVHVVGTRVTLVPPPELEPADRFPGFIGPNGASIQVTEIPGPFKEVTAGFTNPELARKQEMTILASGPVELTDGTSAMWIHARQNYRGKPFLKWVVAFGNASASVLLIATIPENQAAGLEAVFRQSLLSARWNLPSSPAAVDTAGLPFAIRPAAGIDTLMRMGSTIGIGIAGTRLPDKSGSPFFVVAASTEPLDASQLEAASTGILRGTTPDLIQEKVVRSSRSLRVAGRPAHELVGSAKEKDGHPLTFYLVVVADGDGHIQLFGQCRLEDEAKYLPAFRSMTEGLSLVRR